jgi:hypothetical protein
VKGWSIYILGRTPTDGADASGAAAGGSERERDTSAATCPIRHSDAAPVDIHDPTNEGQPYPSTLARTSTLHPESLKYE